MANYYSPKEITDKFPIFVTYKSNLPSSKFVLIAVLGGAFIAFGGDCCPLRLPGGMSGIGEANS